MLAVWILYFLTCIYGARISKSFPDYMEQTQTIAVKGVFAGIIMFSHFLQYITLSDSVLDTVFKTSIRSIGQLMVVMFLFYSGYGIVISSKKKPNYFDTFFRHRILHTLLYYDLAVILFLLCNLCMGNTYPVKRILLSFIGWNSIGNSNWFVFAIIFGYLMTLIAAKTQNGSINNKSLIMITAGCLLYVGLMRFIKNSWWYNTILTFPAGMYFGYYKEKVDDLLEKNYWLCLLSVIVLFSFCNIYKNRIYIYVIYAVLFSILIVLMTYKIKIGNRFLQFLGKYSFDIYLLQRIPAILLQKHISNNVLYFAAFFLGTIICAVAFNEFSKKILSIGTVAHRMAE